MYLAPEGDELEIARAAADFIAETLPIERLHTAGNADLSASAREALGEMGWFALALSEERGGSGLSAIEHALFFREVGRQCGPVDLLAQALATNLATDEGLRGALVAGEAGVALLVPDAASYRLIGASEAAYALLVTRERAALHRLDGAAPEPRPSLDPANSLALAASAGEVLETVDGSALWQLAQAGSAAMLVGLAEAALDLITEYAKVRETFGKAIGAWQAVRHPIADMAVAIEAARAQLWYAVTAIKEGRGDAPAHLDAAKHLANEAALKATDANIQLHGGIGVTDEHDAHLLLKHTALLARLFGSRRDLLARLLHAEMED